ncbi:SLAC1 family transporter [Streptomyces violaceusniger]
MVLATALTLREFRAGLPFAPTWWSFIFPLGAFVTGTGAARTGSSLFTWPAVVFYALLVAAWAVVACRSLGHAAAHAGRPKSRA